jgi:hypothetical protein
MYLVGRGLNRLGTRDGLGIVNNLPNQTFNLVVGLNLFRFGSGTLDLQNKMVENTKLSQIINDLRH